MTVTIIDSKTNATQSSVSNEDGFFEFIGVDSGEYTLVVPPQKGFGPKEISGIHILDRETPLGDVFVDVGQIMGDIAISVEYAQPLNRAVADDNVEMVRELITQGENVNGKDENYERITPLFVAVEHGNVEIIQLLLDAGAKVNARDGERQTPLMRLDDDATPELVDMLLRHGAKINLTDNDNNTALINVAERVTPEVLKAMIDAGADVNVVNKAGQTALMRAAGADSLEKVRMLLEAGARANLKNEDGDNAWDMASDEEVKELLAGYGAEVKITPVETNTGPEEVEVPDDM